MAVVRNLQWLIEQLQLKLGANPTQTDLTFIGPAADTNKYYKDLLNEAGDLEIETAKQVGHRDRFIRTYEFSWPTSDVTLEIPAILKEKEIRYMRDVTNDAVGNELPFTFTTPSDGIFMKDLKTFQWGTTGPSSDTTIRATYMDNYVDLVALIDEPELIAPRFRWVQVWSALVIAQTLGDQSVPRDVGSKHQEWRETWYAYLAKGIPSEDRPAVVINRDPDGYDIF